jgi:hypothetical protein
MLISNPKSFALGTGEQEAHPSQTYYAKGTRCNQLKIILERKLYDSRRKRRGNCAE